MNRKEHEQRLWILVFVGLAFLAGLAGACNAAGKAGDVPAGIQNPLNPEAYMRDLAARMDPSLDRNLLLRGMSTPNARPAPARQPRSVPRVSSPRVSNSVPPKSAAASAPRVSDPRVGAATNSQTRPSVSAAPTPRSTAPVVTASPFGKSSVPVVGAAPVETNTPPSPAAPPKPAPRVPETPAVPVPVRRQAPIPHAKPGAPPMPTLSWAPVPDQTTIATPSQLSAVTPSTGVDSVGSAVLPASGGNRMLPASPAHTATDNLLAQASGPLEKELIAGKSGLTLWNEPELRRQEEGGAAEPLVAAEPPEPNVPWTLEGDLEKYRAYAVREGSRDSGQSLLKALQRAGMTISDGANVFLLGYGSERGKPFRVNDGKGLLQEPGKVPAQAGATVGSFGYALYSLADLATLNSLPDPEQEAYRDNNPLVRPVLFTGRTIGGIWKTTEEIGNALTWGFFDNVTGCVGLVIEDVVEVLKHAGEAVTNVARAPFRLAAGKQKHEETEKMLDWVLLVPLELASNSMEMKGFSNMQDYKTAFADKGVIGSMLEFGGSTYIVYRVVDKLTNKDKKYGHDHGQDAGDQTGGGETTPETPPDVEVPVDTGSDAWIIFSADGQILYAGYSS